MRARPSFLALGYEVLGSGLAALLCLSACGDDAEGSGGAGGATGAPSATSSSGSTGSSTTGSGSIGSTTGGDGGSDVGTGGAGGSEGGSGGAGGEAPIETELATLSGDLTWSLSFDAEAEAGGAFDCTYTRHYEAVEDASAPWFCPTCEVVLRAEVEMIDGLACYAQLDPNPPAGTEWIGYENGVFRRGLGGPMSAQGEVLEASDTLTITHEVVGLGAPMGGSVDYQISGQLERSTTIGDVLNGFRPPESPTCGWPRTEAPPYVGDYGLAEGETVPDGLFRDACEETVRLHELAGRYLFVQMAAADCAPCLALAEQEEAFASDMAAEGIDVRVVTLLAPSLGDTLGTADTELLDDWTVAFGLTTGVVLGDRGWGRSMFEPVFGEAGYPSWVLVAPDLEVFAIGQGAEPFEDFADLLREHAGS